MPEPSQTITGAVRAPRNRAAHVSGSIHDDATASKHGFRGGTVAGSVHMEVGQPAEPAALLRRDLRAADQSQLRILSALHPGDSLGDLHASVSGADQRTVIGQGGLTEPLDWYTGPSPWGGSIASPSRVVQLPYRDLMAKAKEEMGPHVGLSGAIEIRFRSGPVFVDQAYRVTGEVVALADSPKTEGVWYDSQATDDSGAPVADMRMYLRQLKASSPRYRDAVAG